MWEYMYVDVNDSHWGSLDGLNEAGRDGWRFTGYTVDGGTCNRYLMERRKTE